MMLQGRKKKKKKRREAMEEEEETTWLIQKWNFVILFILVIARVNIIYIEESILLPNTPVETRSVK